MKNSETDKMKNYPPKIIYLVVNFRQKLFVLLRNFRCNKWFND